MSRYKAYPEYRDSEIAGVGVIPATWQIMQLKRSVNDCVNGIWGAEPEGDGSDTIVIRVADFDRARLSVLGDGYTFRKIDEKEKKSRLLTGGDLLLEKSGGGEKTLVGQVVLFDKEFEAITSNFVAKMTPRSGFSSRYLNYVFSRFYSSNINFCSIKQNTGIQNLDSASYLAEKFCFPAFCEQEAIATFLDHETAKIDALIEKQQRLIELLKEKRQAVISHAVTKGLNPKAPMQDSGAEWVDAVPKHWRVSKLSYHASVSNGATPSRENMLFWENGTIGWLNSSKVNDGVIEEADQFITELALSKTSVKPVTQGDLVMAITGEGQTRGRVAICNTNATINQHLASISIYDEWLSHEFLYLWLEGNYERIRYESEGAGSTKGAITCSEIGAFPVILPPLEEQDQIVRYVTERKHKFDGLVREAVSAIELMQERRTALISAAVTGKIDVRDWQAA